MYSLKKKLEEQGWLKWQIGTKPVVARVSKKPAVAESGRIDADRFIKSACSSLPVSIDWVKAAVLTTETLEKYTRAYSRYSDISKHISDLENEIADNIEVVRFNNIPTGQKPKNSSDGLGLMSFPLLTLEQPRFSTTMA